MPCHAIPVSVSPVTSVTLPVIRCPGRSSISITVMRRGSSVSTLLVPCPLQPRNSLLHLLSSHTRTSLYAEPAPHDISPVLSTSLPGALSTPETRALVSECVAVSPSWWARSHGALTPSDMARVYVWVRWSWGTGTTSCYTEDDDTHLIEFASFGLE